MSASDHPLPMPYPGLRPFEAEDQPIFFGRDAQVSTLLRQLEDHHFVAVVGSSGCGKSSLVRAGLLPAVREGFLLGTLDWLILTIKPGNQPYQNLAGEIATCSPRRNASDLDRRGRTSTEGGTILTALQDSDLGLLTALSESDVSPQTKVIIVVDQFEELFAFRRVGANRDTVASRDEAAGFVRMLLRSASDLADRIWVVLTMRSDFIGDCEAFLGLPEQISGSQFLVPRLDRVQMEQAITGPAAVDTGAFKPFAFDDGLVNRIINDAGDRPDQLPLMQHALMRTWKSAVEGAAANGSVVASHEDYGKVGGIESVLSIHADAAWDEIKDDQKKANIARRLFLLLCDISADGQIVRRRPKVKEVLAVTGATLSEIKEVISVFQRDDRNFLLPRSTERLTSESYLDISHEVLLRQWKLFFNEWQLQERKDVAELRRLTELANLRAQGQQVGFLPTQDLDRITRWKEHVSLPWALRYVSNDEWDEALLFVEVSRDEARKEKISDRLRTLVPPDQRLRSAIFRDTSGIGKSGLDDAFWGNLLPLISEGEVVPVIGPGAVTFGVGDELLYPWLSTRVSQELDPPLAFEVPPRDLQEVVDAQRTRGQPVERIYRRIHKIVEAPDLLPGSTLAAIAAVEGFRLFISTTFDPLLARAVESASPGGLPEERHGAATLRGPCPDLPSELRELRHRFVYQILGRATLVRDFVVWDDDMLPFLLRLNQELPSLPKLSEALQTSHLLILGVNFVGWFLRFFVEVIKRKRLSEIAGEELALFEKLDPADRDKVVVHLSYPMGIEILPIDPLEFIAEMHVRWRDRYQPSRADPYLMNMEHRHRQSAPGCIYVSYVSPDLEIARYIVHQLQEAGCSVWFNREQLQPGMDWEEELRETIETRCGVFVSLISEHSASRPEGFTIFERKLAARRCERFTESMTFYIPVRIDDAEPMIPDNEPLEAKRAHGVRKPGGHLDSEFINYLRDLQRMNSAALGYPLPHA